MKYRLFGITDVGKVRDHNEDNFVICKDLDTQAWNFTKGELLNLSKKGAVLVVADGMGGTNAGEIASNIAQLSVKEDFQQLKNIPNQDNQIIELLKNSILTAHKKIVTHQHEHLETAGMGTTLVIAWVLREKLYTAWCGDSRCYLFNKNDALYPFTDDHSHVWEMVKQGHLTPEQARVHPDSNLITQNLGDSKQLPKPDGKVSELRTGDRILVCSDGLNGMLSDPQIHYLLVQHKGTAEACKHLVSEANNEGGTDNITCLLMDIDPDKPAANDDQTERKTATFNNLETQNSGRQSRSIWLTSLIVGIFLVLGWLIYPTKEKIDPNNVNPENIIPNPKKSVSDSVNLNAQQNSALNENQSSALIGNDTLNKKDRDSVLIITQPEILKDTLKTK